MPTYEYRCTQCKHTMEEFQSMKDDALVDCPVCHTPNLVRVIGNGSGFIFKGKGFYQTDYKKTGTSPSAASSAKPADDGSPSDSVKPASPKSESTTSDSAKSGNTGSSTGSSTGSGSTSAPASGSAPKSE